MDGPTKLAAQAYTLASALVREERRTRLKDPHIKPLTDYVDNLRNYLGKMMEIPYFDPSDGGICARILFILEAPGPQAVESGFCSIDNPDPSARNFGKLLRDAELSRGAIALWNVVPWYLGDGDRIRAAGIRDLRKALPHLQDLVNLFTELRVIVFVGRKAQRVQGELEVPPGVVVLSTYHPSNRVKNSWPGKWCKIQECLREAGRLSESRRRDHDGQV